MRNRLLSLLLVVVMLFGMLISTVSCQQLEEFIGYENLDQEYLDKYYPGMNQGNNNPGGDQPGGDQPGEDIPAGPQKPGDDTPTVPNEHASYAEPEEGYNLITFYWSNPLISNTSESFFMPTFRFLTLPVMGMESLYPQGQCFCFVV